MAERYDDSQVREFVDQSSTRVVLTIGNAYNVLICVHLDEFPSITGRPRFLLIIWTLGNCHPVHSFHCYKPETGLEDERRLEEDSEKLMQYSWHFMAI